MLHKRHSMANVAPPVLLHVLSHGKMMLGRLARESCTFFIASLAGTHTVCTCQKRPESSELASICQHVVDALSVILHASFLSVSLHSVHLLLHRMHKCVCNRISHDPHASRLVDCDLVGRLTKTFFLLCHISP